MTQVSDFETFLFISKNKYQIFVYDKDNLKNLYNEEIKINDGIELNNLSNFLDENIYKIEKTINNFIRNIILIIEDDKVLELRDNTIIKLPNDKVNLAINLAIKFLDDNKLIDARIENQIILNDSSN